jgi:hypothetical protein
MSIKQTVFTTISAVLNNAWAVELPPNPTFPAVVFEIDTTPEPQWVQGGGYDQHAITVTVLTKTLDEQLAINNSIIAALELLPGYLTDGDKGDADYEGDPSVYGYYSTHVIRLPKNLG